MNCYNLTEIQFPEDLTDIHDYSFFGCKSLFSIVLPKNLIKLGKYSFSNCSSLQKINIESNCSIDLTSFENDNMIEHLIISYPNSDIIKQNSFSHLIKTITYNLSIKEYPSLSIFESLENINIFTYGNESIIKDNFISSKEVNIIIIGNIQKIDDKSFLNSRINNFLYCGDQEVEGNFLIGRHPRNITVYEYYPKSKIGDVAASKTGKCNNLPGDVKHGLTNTQLALIITFSIIVLRIPLRVRFFAHTKKSC